MDTQVINLPPSKSIVLRALTLRFVAGLIRGKIIEPEISEIEKGNEDIYRYAMALRSFARFLNSREKELEINIGEGGAPCRFFIALASAVPFEGEIKIFGSRKLSQRPLSPLIDVINALCPGAVLREDYDTGSETGIATEPHNVLICIVKGGRIPGGEINVDVSLSSQFLSALMMASPLWENGMSVILPEGVMPVSAPYIDMTAEMMNRHGFGLEKSGNHIKIFSGLSTVSEDISSGGPHLIDGAESDWSAAVSIYEALAVFRPEGIFILPGLKAPGESFQGDSRCCHLFRSLGVETVFPSESSSEAFIRYNPLLDEGTGHIYCEDMRAQPDLVPSLVATLCFRNRPFHLRGVANLRYKESDRLEAMKVEMGKLGYNLRCEENEIQWDGAKVNINDGGIDLSSHNDHRIAMALMPALKLYDNVVLSGKGAVTKSFPCFYEEFEKIIKK